MSPTDGGAAETCTLCALPLSRSHRTPVENDDGATFCCRGCLNVYEALDETDDLDRADVRAAVDADESGATDGADSGGDSRDDAVPPGDERAFLRVGGMHCATCETFLESVATGTEGVDGAEASYVTETVRVDYDPDELDETDLTEALSTAGYTAARREDAMATGGADETTLWRLIAGVVVGMMVMMPYFVLVYPVHFGLYPPWMLSIARQQLRPDSNARYLYYLLFWFTTVVLVATGGPILKGAYVSLRTRSPNMDLLIALAAVSAYVFSTLSVLWGRPDVYYDVTVTIVVVITAGNYYESSIRETATDLLSAASSATVDEAHRSLADGSTEDVSVADLAAGDRVLVRAGDRVPVDGAVREGEGTVDEAVVTGDSLPVAKRPGEDVVGGSVLTDGSLVIEVGEDAESSVDRIADHMWNLQSTNHGIQRLADRLAVVFVPAVLALAAFAFVAYLALGAGVTAAVLVALTVLLVSCPCSLGLATPLAVAAGVRDAVVRGIVVFDETVFERVREVDVVAFDKTGTLTTGDLRVRDADAPEHLLGLAAALERQSSHPVASAIADAYGDRTRTSLPDGDDADAAAQRNDEPDRPAQRRDEPDTAAQRRDEPDTAEPRVTAFESHGTGVEGVVDGTTVLVGHPDLFSERGWSVPAAVEDRVTAARDGGQLPVVVGRDGAAEGTLVLGDDPREGWEDTATALSERGIEVVVLTGDDQRSAATFREHPAIERVFAGVPPEAKAETVRQLGAGRLVAMVGDGTNDGPALAAADLGIALGSGTALAVDAADVAIVDDDLASIETLFDLSRAAGRRVKQNVGWAFGYNAVAIPLAILGFLNPLFATVAMASSSLLVVTNSARDLLTE
ncbi:MAG: heavy metal translocating P-type ATPase [Haloarculaceae archaeon]